MITGTTNAKTMTVINWRGVLISLLLFSSIRRSSARRESIAATWKHHFVRHANIAYLSAPVAQWIEYWPPKPGVVGSNPAGRANVTIDWLFQWQYVHPLRSTSRCIHRRACSRWSMTTGAASGCRSSSCACTAALLIGQTPAAVRGDCHGRGRCSVSTTMPCCSRTLILLAPFQKYWRKSDASRSFVEQPHFTAPRRNQFQGRSCSRAFALHWTPVNMP